jgi:hypothetical protein
MLQHDQEQFLPTSFAKKCVTMGENKNSTRKHTYREDIKIKTVAASASQDPVLIIKDF